MLSSFLPAPLVGVISLSLHIINTLLVCVPIFAIALVKFLLPLQAVTVSCNWLLNKLASCWIILNNVIFRVTKSINWEISTPQGLSTQDWYLVVANHQSWVDILALQKSLNGKIPFLKFFIKQQLIWVPFLGLAWWALDFPFMKRYSKSYIKKNPHKKGQDFETTRRACEKFKSVPISIMNFAEGTRFTPEKHQRQSSPYEHLLKPKSGGIGYVLSLMGGEINHLIDVTIDYPDNPQVNFWNFLCGKVKHIRVTAELKPIPEEIKGDYIKDPANRRHVQSWINQLWQDKNQLLVKQRET